MVFFISEKKVNYAVNKFPFPSLGISKGAERSGSWLELGNKRFPVRVCMLAICRGECCVLIGRLLFKWEAGASDSEEFKGYSPLFPAFL